jgi:ATP-dependent protease ClpP protease subunit
MPNWGEILSEVVKSGHTTDSIRRKYIKRLSQLTKRNTIIYYSGFLQKRGPNSSSVDFGLNDLDKNGFMSVIHGLDRNAGLDLVLHTPGGDMAATESIIDYLRQMFGRDIRAIVPQMAMSGGSMIACSCKEIVMGMQSNIGPFDPQIGGMPAQAIMSELERAGREISADPTKAYIWQPIVSKYNLGFFQIVEQSIAMAEAVVRQNLIDCMFYNDPDASQKADAIMKVLGSNAETQTHSRHIHKAQAEKMGLNIFSLEQDKALQDAVLSVHHATMITFEQTPMFKIIENQKGSSYISTQQLLLMGGLPHAIA